MVLTTEICGNYVMGLNFKLDVGLYQLDQQAACQRIGKFSTDANLKESLLATFGNFTFPKLQAVPAVA